MWILSAVEINRVAKQHCYFFSWFCLLIISVYIWQQLRSWRREHKVGQEVFLAAWRHKYLLHSQQYPTVVLPTKNQVAPSTLHSFFVTLQYTHTVSLSLSHSPPPLALIYKLSTTRLFMSVFHPLVIYFLVMCPIRVIVPLNLLYLHCHSS